MKHIPNILSTFRIILIPFIWTTIQNGHFLVAALLVILSGITDLLDGYLARKYNWITQIGKVLDPVADKMTQVALYIAFILYLDEYWPFFAIMIGKEVIMMVAGAVLMKKGAVLEGSKYWGKIATLLFYATMVGILLFPNLPRWVIIGSLSITTISSIVSLLLYIPDFFSYRNQIKDQAK